MKSVNHKVLFLKYFVSFVLVFSGLFIVLYIDKEQKTKEFIDRKTQQANINYHALYNKYKTISNVIFKTKINTPEIIDLYKSASKTENKKELNKIRQQLFVKLDGVYQLLKSNSIKQLHFHLPNNDSFLRFHRPGKYGDNLAGIRSTVEYVNKHKVEIDGFEEGRIFNGYRFVYPLFDNDIHIGSVEVSFSSLAFHKEYLNDYKLASNFLILKEIVDKKVFQDEKKNYVDSPIDLFYYEKSVFKELQKVVDVKKGKSSQETIEMIKNEVLKGESKSSYDINTDTLKSFIPVKNPITKEVSAIYVSLENTYYIKNKLNNFYISVLGVFILLVLVFYFMYKNSMAKIKLNEINENLHQKVKKGVEIMREKDKLLIAQSKNAAIGEMIDAIAHQWVNPIALIKMSAQTLEYIHEEHNIKDEELEKYRNNIIKYSDHVVETLNEFRDFFRPNFTLEEVELHSVINSVLTLMKDELVKNKIEIEFEKNDTIKLHLVPNEFKHVLINLFSNSKDAFEENSIKEKKVKIELYEDENEVAIKVSDNAGGIPSSVIDRVFDPHITTKEHGKGTGIGLYMTKQIIEKIGGEISVENKNNGACFTVVYKKYCEIKSL